MPGLSNTQRTGNGKAERFIKYGLVEKHFDSRGEVVDTEKEYQK
jgi:hypothetical protein